MPNPITASIAIPAKIIKQIAKMNRAIRKTINSVNVMYKKNFKRNSISTYRF